MALYRLNTKTFLLAMQFSKERLRPVAGPRGTEPSPPIVRGRRCGFTRTAPRAARNEGGNESLLLQNGTVKRGLTSTPSFMGRSADPRAVIDLGVPESPKEAAPPSNGSESFLLRKEVIQPHLPVRLPCYDFTPIADPTFDGSLPKGLGHRLRVLPTFVV